MADKYPVDPRVDLTDAPAIMLGGKEWLVPRLPLRQTTAITGWQQKMPRLVAKTPLTEEQEICIAHIVHVGLSRVYKGLMFDDFLDLPDVTVEELLVALPIILRQTHAFRAVEEVADADQGEAAATATP